MNDLDFEKEYDIDMLAKGIIVFLVAYTFFAIIGFMVFEQYVYFVPYMLGLLIYVLMDEINSQSRKHNDEILKLTLPLHEYVQLTSKTASKYV